MLTQKGEFRLNDFSGYSALNKKIFLVSIFVKNNPKISECILSREYNVTFL